MVFTALPPDSFFGVDHLIKRWKEEKPHPPIPAAKSEGVPLERREVLRDLISLPVLGAFAYAVYKKSKWDRYQKVSSATWISTRVRPWRG